MALLFWASLLTIVYAYAGYPVVLHFFSRKKPIHADGISRDCSA